MKCFPFLSTVLDEIWNQLPGTDKDRLAAVRSKESYLHGEYPKLTAPRTAIDYSDPSTRYAYICCYVASHANMVTQLIGQNPEICKLFKQDSVKITCLGGGPGSDLLGILKHVETSEENMKAAEQDFEPVHLKFYLYDGEPAWSDAWGDVDEKISRNISTYFQHFDVSKPKSYSGNSKYLSSDLFTMVYFVSEVYSCRTLAEPFFRNLFARAKPGALFLFVDNASAVFFDWFDSLYAGAGLDVLKKSDGVTLGLPGDEQKSDLKEHFYRISGFPKINGRVAYRVLRKK